MSTWIIRVWVPDRPGALGQVASRIGAVRADVIGIDILERGGGRAIDELAVSLPDDGLMDLLLAEIGQVDGVDVEDVRLATDAIHDPRLDALETAAMLVAADSPEVLLDSLCVHGARTIGAEWVAVVEVATSTLLATVGEPPSVPWLVAFVAGSTLTEETVTTTGPSDIVWAPLPGSGLAVVLGRTGSAYRARERRQATALARIVDTRFRELHQRTVPVPAWVL